MLLFGSTETLIDLQTQRQTIARSQADGLSELGEVINLMDIQIEGFRLDVLMGFQSSLDQIGIDPNAAEVTGQLSLQLNSLVTLGLLIEKVRDLAQSSVRNQSVAGTSEEIRFALRQILGHLNRMTPSPQRKLMAAEVERARALILDPGGILDSGIAQALALSDIARAVAASFAHIQSIETEIANTIMAADSGAQQTNAALKKSIQSLTQSNLVTILFLFGGLTLIVIFIVEGQLNKRIQSLIASVRQFAVGNYNDHISVTGGDELAEVADSLRLTQSVSQDLKRSNDDLKGFAYAASHDLKTPLRAITDLADWTLEDPENDLSEDSRQNLTLLSGRSKRLSNLLDGLLLYAQVDGMSRRKETFNLVDECATIADLLDPNGKFPVTVEPTQSAFATAVIPLRQILHNLISNTIKHHDKASGQITVRASITDDSVEIQVQDDGPGIPQIYHNKIFELFQKLESADVVEGAGIGLALVKKLAERHGGGVRYQSNENGARGTVFTVILMAGPAAAQPAETPKRT